MSAIPLPFTFAQKVPFLHDDESDVSLQITVAVRFRHQVSAFAQWWKRALFCVCGRSSREHRGDVMERQNVVDRSGADVFAVRPLFQQDPK
jgi:hypothetical protein